MFIIGIDLGNEYSPVCYYNVAKSEPESVSFQSPAADLKMCIRDRWKTVSRHRQLCMRM